jgi:hypothetical protein
MNARTVGLDLRMIRSDVANFTRFGLTSDLHAEGVSGMTFVTATDTPVSESASDAVTSKTTLLLHRLRLTQEPSIIHRILFGGRVSGGAKLRYDFLVAFTANPCGDFTLCFKDGFVILAVTTRASHVHTGVHTLAPLEIHPRIKPLMTPFTRLFGVDKGEKFGLANDPIHDVGCVGMDIPKDDEPGQQKDELDTTPENQHSSMTKNQRFQGGDDGAPGSCPVKGNADRSRSSRRVCWCSIDFRRLSRTQSGFARRDFDKTPVCLCQLIKRIAFGFKDFDYFALEI